MDVVQWVLIALCFLAAVYWNSRFREERRISALSAGNYGDERGEHLSDLDDFNLERRKWQAERDRLSAETADAVSQLDKYKSGLQSNQRLLEAQAHANEDLVKQRAEAWALQQEQALMFGNGQTLLLRQYQRLLAEFNQYRESKGDKPLNPSSEVQQIAQQMESP